MTGQFWVAFHQAARAGLDEAGIYPHAQPSRLVMQALLAGLEAAGLLVTDIRLDQIAAAVEDVDVAGMTPEQVRALAAEAVRAGGASL